MSNNNNFGIVPSILLILSSIKFFCSGTWNNNGWLTDKTWLEKQDKNSLAIPSVSNRSFDFALKQLMIWLVLKYTNVYDIDILIFLEVVNFCFYCTHVVEWCVTRVRDNADGLIDRQWSPFSLAHRKRYASSEERFFDKLQRKPELQIWFGLMLDLDVPKHDFIFLQSVEYVASGVAKDLIWHTCLNLRASNQFCNKFCCLNKFLKIEHGFLWLFLRGWMAVLKNYFVPQQYFKFDTLLIVAITANNLTQSTYFISLRKSSSYAIAQFVRAHSSAKHFTALKTCEKQYNNDHFPCVRTRPRHSKRSRLTTILSDFPRSSDSKTTTEGCQSRQDTNHRL